MIRPATNTRTTIMSKFLLAIALVTAFSAPALAASEKASTRPTHRHVESTFKHQWKGGEARSRSADDPYYYDPCHSGFRSWIVNDCDD
jgi:hypothetical protein